LVGYAVENAPPPPNPLQFFINGLADPDPNERIRAADAITLAAEEGINASTAVSALAKLLGDTATVADHAARALYACFLKGGDLSAVLPTLQTSLESPQVEVRSVAARIISRYKILRGEEEPLKLNSSFKVPPANRKSSWVVNASHRRTYALSDDPVRGETPRACGVCNSEKTRCIFVKNGTEEDLPMKELEYKCTACGKYTIYSQEEW
jgi:hypothetical protein